MPGRQGEQSVAPLWRASRPAGHVWHLLQPDELQKVPTKHCEHDVELCTDEKEPGEQLIQLSAPVMLLKLPEGQA